MLESFRSSRPELFLGKGVLKIYSKFTGEYLCRSVISIKLQLDWNQALAWVFSSEFAAYSEKIFSTEHIWMAASGALFLETLTDLILSSQLKNDYQSDCKHFQVLWEMIQCIDFFLHISSLNAKIKSILYLSNLFHIYKTPYL